MAVEMGEAAEMEVIIGEEGIDKGGTFVERGVQGSAEECRRVKGQ